MAKKPKHKIDFMAAAQAIIAGKSGILTATLAGYTGKPQSLSVSGARLKKNPKVLKIIAALTEELNASNLISAKNWLDKASTLYDTTKSDSVKAKLLSTIGKYHALFIEQRRTELSVPSIEVKDPSGKSLFVLGTKDIKNEDGK